MAKHPSGYHKSKSQKNKLESQIYFQKVRLPKIEIRADSDLDRIQNNNQSSPTDSDSGRAWDLPEPKRALSNQLTGLGLKIFYDRYALKDTRKETLELSDIVVTIVNLSTGQREIGQVKSISGQDVTVELRDGQVVTKPIEHIDKPIEIKPEQLLDRVAQGIAAAEKPQLRSIWQKKFRWLLDGYKFVPAGRILTAAGSNQKLTYYNCYVIPSPNDSRYGIIETLRQMNEIFSRGGGVGINVSSLRPRYAYVKGVNGRSSGAVSWAGLYSYSTGLIEQGGSRRGALMLILNVWHPDVLDFIISKTEMGKITNANISIGITDTFMRAVEQDLDWDLVFPDLDDPDYDQLWDGNLEAWQTRGKKVKIYKTVKAKKIWDSIIQSAWQSAEPGVFFVERYNKQSNSWYFAPILCTNPCGEQGLPAWGVCNLGAINLSRFVVNGGVDWQLLKTTIWYSVRFLDDVIDATPYFFKENEKQQKGERRVGLNTMGLAEMMIKLGIRYGSNESLVFIDKLYQFIASQSYLASIEIAKEKGPFPFFDAQKHLQSGYMKSMPQDVREKIKKHGVRNVTLLTQAPNGTIGTMVATSTGIEPFYSWTYFRKSRLGVYEENVKIVQEWLEKNPNQDLPDYFVTAMSLSPQDHVKVMAAVQRWVDASISKTCNLPNHYTVDDTRVIYELMYKLGIKAGTIYRDGSRDEQVLTTDQEQAQKGLTQVSGYAGSQALEQDDLGPKKSDSSKVMIRSVNLGPSLDNKQHTPTQNIPTIRPMPERREGVTISKKTPAGTAHITVNKDLAGQPFEVFIEIGKAGSDLKAMAEGLGRLASLLLRISSPLEPTQRVQEVIKQLKGIGGGRSVGFGKNKVMSLPDAVAQVLEEVFEINANDTEPQIQQLSLDSSEPSENHSNPITLESARTPSDLCPSCGNASYFRQESCQTCLSCGYSECA